MPTNNITCANQIQPDPIKRKLIADLGSVMRNAGLPIRNVSYGIVEDEECYTIRMISGAVHRICVTEDDPVSAAARVLGYMHDK
ncbi:hypothetical protein SAMN02910447_01669 [Ruminococcus sp. YE71]|uniref:hypothetical protein n=1 Tax=unclassified Ruminococcus TaxID=2608920 RepID=UPI000880D357|nr:MULTISPECIES: hypothetical protein [unclassified Ruminococcus]SDA20036.1 hypothetical protein SAMN02910446_01670 [Ruminococcus sp. YE78]SFW31739.1 hypothetical protein SAMN02910447_01669 [Ruminococcus sp. YE71]